MPCLPAIYFFGAGYAYALARAIPPKMHPVVALLCAAIWPALMPSVAIEVHRRRRRERALARVRALGLS